jgi:YD repeat-containing protein
MGNVRASNQQTMGQTYAFAYTYNLTGALTSETYPSGRVVTTGYDGVNREKSVTGQYVGVGTNYVSGTSYAPQGALSAMTYGNTLARSYTYDNRLRPSGLWDAVNNNPGSVLFSMGPVWLPNGNLDNVTTNHGGPGFPNFLTFHEYFW